MKNKENKISHGRGNSPRNVYYTVFSIYYSIVYSILIYKTKSQKFDSSKKKLKLNSDLYFDFLPKS